MSIFRVENLCEGPWDGQDRFYTVYTLRLFGFEFAVKVPRTKSPWESIKRSSSKC